MNVSTAPILSEIFACNDQSALSHNYVVSSDPPPGAWSHHSAPQSPLGRVAVPEVLTLPRGDVFTRGGDGQLVEHMLLRHEWLPWRYHGESEQITVDRAVARDIFAAQVKLKTAEQGLLLVEYAPAVADGFTVHRDGEAVILSWRDFVVRLSFSARRCSLLLSDDPAQLKRKFCGFDDVQLNEAHMQWAVQYQRRIYAGLFFEGEVEVRLTVSRGSQTPADHTFAGIVKQEQERWEAFFADQVPPLHTDDAVIRDAYYFAWLTLWANRCDGGRPLLPGPYTSPSRFHYGSQWFWDSSFHAAAYRHLSDPDICYQELRNLWLSQDEDGGVPGCLLFGKDELRTAADSSISMQPPVIGFILMLLAEKPGWPTDTKSLYHALLRHAHWNLSSSRDTDGDELSEFLHCFETGTDQSPRWDAFKLDKTKTIDAIRPVEPVDLNVWMSELWRVLAKLAGSLGLGAAASEHEARARFVMEHVDDLMWDESDGIYYDIDAHSHQRNPVKSNGSFMPLLSPYADRERLHRMVHEHLLNPSEFWCDYPVPSVALDDPTFDLRDMWRGPSWVNFNWMIIEGLHRHEFHDVARQLARKTVELVGPRYEGDRRTRTPRIWEWFNPVTGDPLGNEQYSWSALVVDLILRFLV